MAPRLELQKLLETMGAAKVYFQPPNGTKLVYPCIVYHRDSRDTKHADNRPYLSTKRYLVTVMDRSPDSPIAEKIAALPMSNFVRWAAIDELNHDIYNLYF